MNGKRFSIFSREAKLPPAELLRREAEVEAAQLERDILERNLLAIQAEHDLRIRKIQVQMREAQRSHIIAWLSRPTPKVTADEAAAP